MPWPRESAAGEEEGDVYVSLVKDPLKIIFTFSPSMFIKTSKLKQTKTEQNPKKKMILKTINEQQITDKRRK